MSAEIEKTLRICNKRGLHARAAAKFVRLAEGRRAEITVSKDGVSVCGTSIMGLLMLSASKDTEIRISAVGDEAEAVLDEISALIERRFDEE